jgi:hypothetical protein
MNQFPSLIEKADNAAIEYEKILNYIVVIKNRTINGEKFRNTFLGIIQIYDY